MDKNEYSIIAGKVADGIASEKEITLYNAYYNQYQLDYATWNGLLESEQQEMLDEVKASVHDHLKSVSTAKTLKLWTDIGAAAVIIFVLYGAFYLYISRNTNTRTHLEMANQDEIKPGKVTATLTMANGRVIQLNNTSQLLAKQEKENGVGNELILRTPHGGTYQIKLPDGTKVWLNAASSLTYRVPMITQGVRSVKMSGEAYFEVAKDKEHPFVVKTVTQSVEVLGTHFNISAYDEDVKTTLVEGSVKVVIGQFQQKLGQKRDKIPAGKSVTLKPGEQSLAYGNKLSVYQVDPELAIAWKKGNFTFKNEKLEAVMQKIAYWYKVDVVYQNKPLDAIFTGNIKRSVRLSEILHILELTGNVKFEVKGRTVYVMDR